MNKHCAKLISITPNAIALTKWAWDNMHKPITGHVKSLTEEEERSFIDTLYKVPHKTVLEFISTAWLINGSRAFQQQLTRTRDAAYSIQSLRIVEVGYFFDRGDYHTPPGLSTAQDAIYQNAMAKVQDLYRCMLGAGMPVEAARGILPLNINSPITMSINMRDLVHMMELRLCENAQSEYRDIARDMKEAIALSLGDYFAETFFRPPCGHTGKCNSTNPCGKVHP